ncbi:MAG: alkaline phosphatase family protein [Planctomycetota bacterium]|jgi:predicted AlkP superfamily phosphohydrolase/phosphomutase|nr:alkaline phosphatase family protein [Planctomycetota bacterium]MDP6941677.1 alkaline phosphatase family protein [Planctomycetota bacterium]
MSESSNPRNPKGSKVVFVGIDGATWEIIEPMVQEGKLPNLAAMMEKGSWGTLHSTLPPNSSLAWSSFQTGVNPGKHGVFFFREQRHGTYDRPVISFDSIQAPTIWKLASDHEKKVVCAWMPLTYPPEELNGVTIGGLLTPDSDAKFVLPLEKRAELEKKHGRVPSDNEPERLFHSSNETLALESLLETTDLMTEIGIDLLESESPDLFALVFRGVDLASHQSWCFQDPEWARANPKIAAERRNLLGMVYEKVDSALGELRTRALEIDPDTVFCCCSDHGFGPISYRFFVNRWLVENGYLVLKKTAHLKRIRATIQRKWHGLLRRTGLARWLMNRGQKISLGPETLYRDMVDWSRTRAWSSFSGGEDIVLVNLKGREPEGIVEPGDEYESLRVEIQRGLESIRSQDGTQIISKAWKREDLWHGPQLHLAPDIQFITHETSVNCSADPLHSRVVEPAVEGRPAMHRVNGVFLIEGAGVVKSGKCEVEHEIADMAPTILHLLGLPTEDTMDGKVMENCLKDDWKLANPISVREGFVSLTARSTGDSSSPDDDRLMETMRALGYME